MHESKLYLDIVGGDIAGGDDADEKGDVDEDVDGGADGDADGGDANHGGLVCNYVASCIYIVGGNVDNIVSHVNAVVVFKRKNTCSFGEKKKSSMIGGLAPASPFAEYVCRKNGGLGGGGVALV